ncbi:hypothetical protein ACFL6C_09525 [Myxococcota bacterium]
MTRVVGVNGLDPYRGVSLGHAAAQIILGATSVSEAHKKLETLATTFPLDNATLEPSVPSELAELGPHLLSEAEQNAAISERRLEQTIRALTRKSPQEMSEAQARVLAQDAFRCLIEVRGWRCLGSWLGELSSTKNGPAVMRKGGLELEARTRQLYAALTDQKHVTRHRRIATLTGGARKEKAETKSDTGYDQREREALTAMLTSTDPNYGSIVRSALKHGAGITDLRESLANRLVPVMSADKSSPEGDDGQVDSYQFDMATNRWIRIRVSEHRSWVFDIRLAQLLGFEVDNVINGREEIAARLIASSLDPGSDEPVIAAERIEKFVDDLAVVASTGDPIANHLLDLPLEFYFVASKGGNKPETTYWDLAPRQIGSLFAAIEDTDLVERMATIADAKRQADEAQLRERLELLAPILEKYRGEPERHGRAHWAMINLCQAGQSVWELGRDGGALPRSNTLLDPEVVKSRFADADHHKLRFVVNTRFDICTLSDEEYGKIGCAYGFPPNHEVLSYNHPVVATGYLTIDRGRIVGIEDDGVMVPGKLPPDLPPMHEILKALAFDLDEERIASSMQVVDWKAFAEYVLSDDLPPAPEGTLEEVREALTQCPHGERAKLVAAVLVKAYQDSRDSGEPSPVDFALEVLEGFRLINVGVRSFADGELPTGADEVDREIASCLINKVAQRWQ